MNNFSEKSERYQKKIKEQRQTLCWECDRPDCPWMQKLEAVPGWTAESTTIKNRERDVVNSYHVISCPMFRKTEDKKC